jgi:hypothetical protein
MADTDKYVHVATDASSAEKGYHNNPLEPDATYVGEDSHSNLHRGLKSRQVAMIAIGGAIGTSALFNLGKGPVNNFLRNWFDHWHVSVALQLIPPLDSLGLLFTGPSLQGYTSPTSWSSFSPHRI